MRVADGVLVAVVGALAVFVGIQVVSQRAGRLEPGGPRPRRTPNTVAESSGGAPAPGSSATAAPALPYIAPRVVQPASVAPVRDLEAIRARIAGTPGTYMTGMLADLDGQLVRWPDLRATGLRVWVQSPGGLRDWDPRYTQMARDAFADWGSGADGGGVPVRLDFVMDSATSDVRVVWIDRFPADAGQRAGSTRRVTDAEGWIHSAEITVAIHDSASRTIPPEKLAGVVRHEAGHALGLGHSSDPATAMFPVSRVSEIQPADRATLRLLYRLPPGSVR